MQSTELTLRPFLWRAVNLFPEKEIVSRTARGEYRYTYGEFGDRVAALGNALESRGVSEGTAVGTFGWNHHRHFETLFAVPLLGATVNPVNVVLPDDHIQYVINDAGNEILFVEPGEPFETIERLWDRLAVEEVVVMDESAPETDVDVLAYDDLIADAPTGIEWPSISEDLPACLLYTSGTTGEPKGVPYTHKMVYTAAMTNMTPIVMDIDETDVILNTIPAYHVNAWQFPYCGAMAGSKQVFPGPSPDPADLATFIEDEQVTVSAGVPTVWIDMLEYLEGTDTDISSLETVGCGGSPVPEAILRQYEDEYGVQISQTWGMTETTIIGSISRPKSWMADWSRDERMEKRTKQGLLCPGIEMKVVDDEGNEVAWDGEAFGELYLRGPYVAARYYNRPDANEENYENGWLKSGDIVTVDEDGYIEIVDRAKDVIKSGGEWISSVELETALMDHPDVTEAAVIAVPHDRWQERPVACVTIAADATVTDEELMEFLREAFPEWWLPDNILRLAEIPRTATGKFDKKQLRDEFDDVEEVWSPER